jgi:6-phosphogluconolactonase
MPAHDTPAPEILLHANPDEVAAALAARLLARLTELQTGSRVPQLALTGGRIATKAYSRVATEGRSSAVDWSRVELWWGDERFVPADDDERNERGARRALLDPVGVPDQRVHAMPPSDGSYASVEEAADWYAGELAAYAPEGRRLPRFDVLLLGMGPEGHVASIFPESPAVSDERPVFAVHDCPKPPPTRVSLGFSAINTAEEVWLLVSGAGKAEAVARALERGDGAEQLPAAGVHGVRATRWLLDAEAAGQLSG